MPIYTDYPIKNLNTFHIDAKTKYYAEINQESDLTSLFMEEVFTTNKKLYLGEGSNILFSGDFDGIILKINLKGISVIEETDSDVIVEAAAGEKWDSLVNFCVEKGFYGVENLSGIPGTVGAAPIQNIGAYGVELKDVFHSLEGYFADSSKKGYFDLADCDFGYRYSVFKERFKGNFIVTRVRLKLSKIHTLRLNYRDLKEIFRNDPVENIKLIDVRESILGIRQNKLPDPLEFGNAGSFFKNPEISNKRLKELHEKFPDIVHFNVDSTTVKVPAAWLIEKSGMKGYRLGQVATHSKQPLVIINLGGAKGAEIVEFAEFIQKKVEQKFQIDLIPEVNIV
jgi:UDP-N-acetylmuramate dehydrogenase